MPSGARALVAHEFGDGEQERAPSTQQSSVTFLTQTDQCVRLGGSGACDSHATRIDTCDTILDRIRANSAVRPTVEALIRL